MCEVMQLIKTTKNDIVAINISKLSEPLKKQVISEIKRKAIDQLYAFVKEVNWEQDVDKLWNIIVSIFVPSRGVKLSKRHTEEFIAKSNKIKEILFLNNATDKTQIVIPSEYLARQAMMTIMEMRRLLGKMKYEGMVMNDGRRGYYLIMEEK